MEEAHDPAPDADSVLGMAAEGLKLAGEAGARASAELAGAGPAAVIYNLRCLKVALDAATAEPAAVDRLSRGAYHLAGLLDAAGLLPVAAVVAAAEAVAAYAGEPDQES
jgi:hypothetical protein